MAERKRMVGDETAKLLDNVIESPMAQRRLSVSETLRGRRIECGLEISHVAQVLRIRPSVLSAIEDGRFGELPGQVYAVGFVRSYAAYLGLDADALVVRFKAETAGTSRKPHLHFPLPISDSRVPTGPLLIICVLLAALTYGGWYYLSRPGQMAELTPSVPERLRHMISPEASQKEIAASGQHQATGRATGPAASQTLPAAPEAAPPAVATTVSAPPAVSGDATRPASIPQPSGGTQTPADGVPPVESRPGSATVAAIPPAATDLAQPAVSGDGAKPANTGSYGAADGDARVVLKANADSWIQVRDKGGNLLFTRVLKAGEHYNAPNQPGLTLVAGNAGGLDIAVDGVDVPHIGEIGHVARNVSLDPDRLQGAAPKVN